MPAESASAGGDLIARIARRVLPHGFELSDSIRREPSILRRGQVEARTGLARSTIYQYIKDGTVPTPVQLGPRAVGWIESAVSEWIGARSKVAGVGVRPPLSRA